MKETLDVTVRRERWREIGDKTVFYCKRGWILTRISVDDRRNYHIFFERMTTRQFAKLGPQSPGKSI